jgi:formylglycine-generating enzyme required for sulfatase activity
LRGRQGELLREPRRDGGTFYRTYPDSDNCITANADPATVSSFRLDKYDVTVGRFRQFVNAVLPPDGGAGWMPEVGSGKHTHLNGGKGLVNTGFSGGYEPGWVTSNNIGVTPTSSNLGSCMAGGDLPGYFNYSTWTDAAGTRENLPITCVSWYEAYAFCIWDGGAFLPSEAEWEYAAAGGDEQRKYPWGSTDPGRSFHYAIYNCAFPIPGMDCTGVSNIAPVGTATQGVARWGQLDLAGNVEQWNLDLDFPYVACTDCATLDGSLPDESAPVERGGNFGSYDAYFILPTTRSECVGRYYRIGFRCARAP